MACGFDLLRRLPRKGPRPSAADASLWGYLWGYMAGEMWVEVSSLRFLVVSGWEAALLPSTGAC